MKILNFGGKVKNSQTQSAEIGGGLGRDFYGSFTEI
jgi:hypothetical protein